MKLKLILLLTFLVFSLSAFAQLDEYFHAFLEEGVPSIVSEYDAIGISVAVIAGEEEWIGAAGLSSAQDSLTTDHVLAIGSITKPLVSACILGLMEEGKLRLSDPIDLYLEDRNYIDSTISIKQLLNHTSGIYNYTNNPIFFDTIFTYDDKYYEAEEVLDGFLLESPFAKGERQEYSNTNYLLLGMIIEQITGRPYYEEIIDRFALEQNYPSVTLAPYIQSPESMAHVWLDLQTGMTDLQQIGLTLNSLFTSAGAAGAFVATPLDLARIGRDLFSGELLSPASMDSFYNYHPLLLFGQLEYGLGVSRAETYCGVTNVGHNGGIIYSADLTYVEEYDLTVAVMTNDGRGIVEVGGVSGIGEEIICQYEASVSDVAETELEASDIKVFPNPFVDYITVEYTNESSSTVLIEVVNEMGQIIVSKLNEGQGVASERLLRDTELGSGVYYLRITRGEMSEIRKVVKL